MKTSPLRKAGFFFSDNKFSVVEYLVMAGFFPEAGEKTIKELQERVGYSYERVYTALKKLHNKDIVKERKVGKTLTYTINTKNNAVQPAFFHFSMVRKSQFAESYPSASKALDDLFRDIDVDLAIVFGSYSKGEAKRDSDLDLLCVSRDKGIEGIALSMRHKYNLKINPVIVEFREFKNIRVENPEFWLDLVECGVVFRGHELFYYTVYG